MSKEETRAELLLRQDVWKAGLLVNGLGAGAIDYKNAVMCLKDTLSILESLPVDDPAHEHFVKQVCHFQKLAAAHAVRAHDKDGTVYTDHIKPCEVMWCYRANDGTEVIEETVLHVPLSTRPYNIDFELLVAGSRRLILENLKPENLASLQIVNP